MRSAVPTDPPQSRMKGRPAEFFVKFDVICPTCDLEMTTGGRDIASGERATAYCPKCGHSVVIRATRL
jgi:hypothetical protein